MFRLLTSDQQHSFLFFDRSATTVVTALMLDDLDDRIDMLRGVLSVDPLLAAWVIHEANHRDGICLDSLNVACRWLEQNFASGMRLKADEGVSRAGLDVWHSVFSTAVSSARHARARAICNRVSVDQAYWLALLGSTKRQIDALTKLNGHSPLRGETWQGTKWLAELDDDLRTCDESHSPVFAARQAIELTSSTDTRWIEQGEIAALLAACPTAKRLIPAAMKKLHRLRQLEEEFSATLLQEKMAAMQQLAYGASHEINNPLANISSRAQSLVHTEHDADRRRKLLAINDQAFRAYEMIADLMLFAKPPKLQMDAVNLNRLVVDVRKELEGSSAFEQVALRVEADQQVIVLHGDQTQLGVAFKAVCINGIEAMGGCGELGIELSSSNAGEVAISIRDSGPGLSELARRHLFDPFFSGREAGRGLGFGLSKAWRIVQLHRGRIDVSSDPTRGTCFTITLPTEKPDAQI